MSIEVMCGGCGRPIGANGFTMMVSGYCVQCSANLQMKAQLEAIKRMNPNLSNDRSFTPTDVKWDLPEKEVFGETIRAQPAIGVDDE
ncbi:hypothetical protein D3C80_1335720 [compost metagenome]